MCVKIARPFITKYGTPLAPITKYGTAYVPRSYTHSLRNMELLLPLLLNMEHLMWQDHTPFITKYGTPLAKITHPFITKYGTPLAPITKYGTAYVARSYTHLLRNMELLLPRSHTHSLRNMEPLLHPLLNMERLMCQDHTPIHYEIWKPL